MASTLPVVYVNTYENNVRFQAQQGINRARPYCQEVYNSSISHNWPTLAKSTAALKSGRGAATPDGETVWGERQSLAKTYDVGDLTGQEDIVQMIVDPNGSYAKSHGMAMRRSQDTEIFTEAVGDSRDGDGGAVTFLATQNIGDGSASISYDIVTEVTEKFLENDIDPSERKVFFITPAQQRKLLQLTEATSRDYNEMNALRTGYVDNWMGFTWVVSTLLPAGTGGQGVAQYNIAMTESAMGFAVNRDITADIAQDPGASFDWRVYCASTFGAVRIQDEHLVRCDLSETI
jgi:hypothetical protein